ncbi:MAG: cellulase family glycosylhydrolase [Nitrospirae bacterium]|nr:cellulase family glycosylhydrolase [Nitrospirota bacterium]
MMRGMVAAMAIAASLGILLIAMSSRPFRPAASAASAASASGKLAATAPADGLGLPPNWPWRGVQLDMSGGDAEVVAGIARDLHANAIRVDLAPRWTMSKYGCSVQKAWELNLAWADRVLDACRRFGVVGIISYSQYPEDPGAGYIQDDPRFWESRADREAFMKNVSTVVGRFRGRGDELGGYYFMIEPLERSGGVKIPDAWPGMARDIVGAVRRLDGDRHVVMNPGPGGLVGGFRELRPLDDPHVIYSTHMYMPLEYTHQGANKETGDFKKYEYPGLVGLKHWDKAALEDYLSPVAAFQERHGGLVWIGEFSEIRWAPGCERYLEDCIDVFQSHGWGWSYFGYGGYHGWNLHYNGRFSTAKDRADTISDGPSARALLLAGKMSVPYPGAEAR